MSITTSSHAIVGTPLRPLRRGRDNCIVGGVCGGFATRLGIKERNIRVIFALLTLLFGFGILLYMTFWLVLTRSGEEHSIIQQIFLNRREAQLVLVAFIATIVLIITLESTGTHASEGFGWPLLLSAFAGFAVWGAADGEVTAAAGAEPAQPQHEGAGAAQPQAAGAQALQLDSQQRRRARQ